MSTNRTLAVALAIAVVLLQLPSGATPTYAPWSTPVSSAADIWVSTRPSVLDPWTLPTNVTEVNTTYGEAQPTLSSKGDTLIFNSARPGAIGMTDLLNNGRQ